MWNQTAQHMALVPFSNYGGPMYEDAYYEDEKPMVEENAESAEDERDADLHPEQRYPRFPFSYGGRSQPNAHGHHGERTGRR